GKIQIFDATDGKVVESIDVGKVGSKTIGAVASYKYYPVIAAGKVVEIFPVNGELQYGKTYYVLIEGGALKNGEGAYAGLSDSALWRFSTKKNPPKLPPEAGRRITVAADGTGDFCTVQGAVDFVPANNNTPTTIDIKRGTYTEMISITGKNALTFLGEDRKKTVIQYATNANFNNAPGGGYRRGVFLTQRCSDIVLANLTVHNTTPQGGSQAEAIIFNGSPTARAIVTGVDLLSYQDTLQINGQAYVSNTYIEGDVDFMWGSGPCFFENCECKAMARQGNSKGYYTQIRNRTNHGYVYYKCTFDGQDKATGFLLGRIDPAVYPNSEVVLIDCQMTSAVGDVAWQFDNRTNPNAATDKIQFLEYNSHDAAGNPVDVSKRLAGSKQLKLPADEAAVKNYGDASWVLGGWTPKIPEEVAKRIGK
ncbi:MAG TPA: pectinesterase family protein, partial [Phycisphaerae bacterium]|nr:pectinesterase family protein [Phycisphaerae bacterium]